MIIWSSGSSLASSCSSSSGQWPRRSEKGNEKREWYGWMVVDGDFLSSLLLLHLLSLLLFYSCTLLTFEWCDGDPIKRYLSLTFSLSLSPLSIPPISSIQVENKKRSPSQLLLWGVEIGYLLKPSLENMLVCINTWTMTILSIFSFLPCVKFFFTMDNMMGQVMLGLVMIALTLLNLSNSLQPLLIRGDLSRYAFDICYKMGGVCTLSNSLSFFSLDLCHFYITLRSRYWWELEECSTLPTTFLGSGTTSDSQQR